MNFTSYLRLATLAVLMGSNWTSATWAECMIVDGDKKMAFDGHSLERLWVEKKSLTRLNKQFPNLNVIEKTFKGEVRTCSSCTERHIVCGH